MLRAQASRPYKSTGSHIRFAKKNTVIAVILNDCFERFIKRVVFIACTRIVWQSIYHVVFYMQMQQKLTTTSAASALTEEVDENFEQPLQPSSTTTCNLSLISLCHLSPLPLYPVGPDSGPRNRSQMQKRLSCLVLRSAAAR